MQLSNKDIRVLNEQINTLYCVERFFEKKDRVERQNTNAISIISQNGAPVFFLHDGLLLPTLRLLHTRQFLPIIVIDQPAVPFITKGADLMRPGIVSCNAFLRDAVVAIVDEKNKTTVAVGRALVSSEDLLALEKGRVIQNLHYVGDAVWTME